MERIILEDGSEKEVPSDEELAEMKAASERAKELETKLEETSNLMKELEEGVNPNFRAMREKQKILIEQLKKEGKEVDENGNIVDPNTNFNAEEIMKKAEETGKRSALQTLLEERKNSFFKKYDAETKQVVEQYFNKLSTGEELTLDNVEKFIKQAEQLSNVSEENSSIVSVPAYGSTPKFKVENQKNSFAETEEAKNIAKEIWGDDAFSAN
jgi:ferritin-like metal-binding protein YciE